MLKLCYWDGLIRSEEGPYIVLYCLSGVGPSAASLCSCIKRSQQGWQHNQNPAGSRHWHISAMIGAGQSSRATWYAHLHMCTLTHTHTHTHTYTPYLPKCLQCSHINTAPSGLISHPLQLDKSESVHEHCFKITWSLVTSSCRKMMPIHTTTAFLIVPNTCRDNQTYLKRMMLTTRPNNGTSQPPPDHKLEG